MSVLHDLLAMFSQPFNSAKTTYDFFQLWREFNDFGFTFPQLNFIVQDRDDLVKPIALSKPATLELAKTLYDGISAIAAEQADLPTTVDTAKPDPTLDSALV